MSFILLIFLVLAGCESAGKTVLQPFARISPPPVVDGETSLYEWVQDSVILGYRQITIRRVLTEVPVFLITTIDHFFEHQFQSQAQFKTESTVVTVTREDLTPKSSLFVPALNDTLFWVAANYQNHTAQIITRTRSGNIQNQIPLGAMSFDIYQLPLLCRGVKIHQPNLPLHILLVIPLSTPLGGISVRAEISTVGNDTITVPAGSFVCQKLNIKSPDYEADYWIEKIGARRLIQYYNRDTRRKLRLVRSTINN